MITAWAELDASLVDSAPANRQQFVDREMLAFKGDMLNRAGLPWTDDNYGRITVHDLGKILIESFRSDGSVATSTAVYRFRLELAC